MASFTREQLDDWTERWLEANREAERKGDWKGLADFYTDDATYGWNIGPKEDVMCVGKDEIYGIGGSWFRLDSNLLIEWQRDFFDFGHVAYMFGKLIGSGDLSEGMQKRIERSVAGEKLPGYYPLGQAPVKIW